ncbi:uncharacterized protein [Physcomitrium patens]|uniref:uncharacterized protein isoform X4 n=1 Tax=Physcomitrium patens TaxID=3218 RepID=UPI000D16BAB1|nr:uncharacterized protein LOC112285817 isoform X4 [Physcomitrium patens]|eukprot:XP_024382804.1 uncharacterized protein LOC112285817 isoform X4 [Physcomitrella patens]
MECNELSSVELCEPFEYVLKVWILRFCRSFASIYKFSIQTLCLNRKIRLRSLELFKFQRVNTSLCKASNLGHLTSFKSRMISYLCDPISLRYNDKAVLESHHAATAFLTMRGHDNVNIMFSLDEPHQRHLRRLVLSCILATDMGVHAEIISSFTGRLNDRRPFELSAPYTPPGPMPSKAPEPSDTGDTKTLRADEASMSSSAAPPNDGNTNQPPPELKSPNPKYLLPPLTSSSDVMLYMQMIIKCADLSNVVKPFFLSKRWSALLLLEWFRQGDIERELGMRVSKFMERSEPTTLMDMTIGCIDFVAKPMFEATAVLLPHLHDEALANLTLNRSLWSSFSMGGRRGSEVARNILGPFLPPPITIDGIAEKFGEAAVKMDISSSSLHYDMYLPGVEKESLPMAPLQLLPTLSPEEPTPLINELRMDEHHPSLLALDSSGDKSQSINKGPLRQDRESSILGGAAPLSLLRVNRNASLDASSGDGNNLALRSFVALRRNTVDERNRKPSSISLPPPGYKGTEMMTDPSKNVALDIQSLAFIQDSAWDNRKFWDSIRRHPNGKQLHAFLESRLWISINIIATFVAMFANDFTKAILPKAADAYETHILSICLFIFFLEIIMLSILSQGYFLGFFFWLDLIGSVSLLTVITNVYTQNLVIARTGRAVKAMNRLSKSMQATPLSSMFPITYILKVFHYKNVVVDDDEDEYFHVVSSTKPSQVWTELSELTAQKLIIGLLVMMIVSPLFRDNHRDLGPKMSLNTLDEFHGCTAHFNETIDRIQTFNMLHGYNLLYMGINGMCCGVSCALDSATNFMQIVPSKGADGKKEAQLEYRTVELKSVLSDSNRTEALYSIRSELRTKHALNMAMTVLWLIILGAWSFVLSNDSNRLLIQPIERMVEIVKELSDDPVSFAARANVKQPAISSVGQVMETRVVEAALVKIASLSKVALGDAGMDILSVNLKGGSEFNPMIPGKKIRACFGFCDIRNFTDATECLQEDVMMFVNKIADVVHNKVVFHSGFPNKNIGDAFLLVWKKSAADNIQKTRGTNSFADRALQSFLDIIQCIETSQTLAEYAMHPAIQKRMPGYKIHMGFGLHVGWAIEGAIGSAHKVDPTYLSPHVNVSSRLEAATKQYGVMMLISETVVAELTKSSLRHCCRKLDRITVKGSAAPIIIYTFDLPLFQQDLKGNPADYRALFENAVDNYIEGNWSSALEKLEECLQLWPTDKPGHVLLNFMASHNYRIPASWKGYRELTEK